jgi:cobalt-zinc-cadmium efflux system outer membrane protein
MSPFLETMIGNRSKRLMLPIVFLLATCAADAAPLSLNAALALAEQNSPELQSNAAQIDAAESTSIPAGSLPNPKIYAGLDNFPVTGKAAGQLNTDNMTMSKIGIMQDIPNAAKRRAQVDISKAKVDVAQAQRPITLLKLRESTAVAWYNRYFLERKIALFDSLFSENKLLAQTVHAQIASGRSQVADAVLPQQEAAQLEDQRDDLNRDLSKAKSTLRRYLGMQSVHGLDQSSDQKLTQNAPELPINAEQLHHHLHHHPELQAFAAESQLADAKVEAAQSLKKSDLSVEFGYSHRAPQFGDMIGVQLTFELPIFTSHRVDPLIAAAMSEQADIDAQREVVLRDHSNMLENDLADYAALNRQLERANLTALPLAQQKVTLQLASYQAGKVDLGAVLTARRELIEQRLKIITLANMRAVTAAQLYFGYGGGIEEDKAVPTSLQGAMIK